MQTLIDPYELSGPLSVAPPPVAHQASSSDERLTLIDLGEIDWEETFHGNESRGCRVPSGPRVWSSEE